jgi:hypothetical protein
VNRRLLGGGLLAAVLLVGCGSEPEQPRTLPPVSAAPSPSASAESQVPADARAETPQGAAAFAEFFYKQVARGFQTQNPSLVQEISLPSCEACTRYIESIQSVRDDDLRVEGGDFKILFAVSPAEDAADEARVDVGWDFEPVKYYDSNGALVDSGPAVSGVEETMQLVRRDDSWMVASLVQVRQRP